MKRMKYPRPSCEECGRVELTEVEKVIWYLLNTFLPALVISNGFGGFSINPVFAESLCKEYGIDSHVHFVKIIIPVIREIVKQEEKKEEAKND